MRAVRWLALSIGILFLVGTVFQLIDWFNLYATPPDTQAANMVDQRLAAQDYRVAIWPIFFLNNFSFGLAFVAITGLGFALLSSIESRDLRRVAVILGLGVGGILGAVGQLILLGATRVTIDIAYCDCGFKETEIVSQIWAQMLANGASEALVDAASILAAVGSSPSRRVCGRGCRLPGRSSPGSRRQRWSSVRYCASSASEVRTWACSSSWPSQAYSSRSGRSGSAGRSARRPGWKSPSRRFDPGRAARAWTACGQRVRERHICDESRG